jgi:hypothetical protein
VHLVHGSQSSILLGFQQRARVRGKVPINTDLSSLLLIPNSSCCLPGCTLYTWVPISILLGISQQRGSGWVPINTDLSSLLLVPDNSSCCLPGCTYTRSQSSILLGILQAGLGLGARSQSILTCQACCWSLTAAVACLGARTYTGPNPVLGFRNSRGSG